MVNMSHDRDNGRPRDKIPVLHFGHSLFFNGDFLVCEAHFFDERFGRFKVEELVDYDHFPLLHEPLDNIVYLYTEPLGKFLDGDPFTDLYGLWRLGRLLFRFRRRQVLLLALLLFLLFFLARRRDSLLLFNGFGSGSDSKQVGSPGAVGLSCTSCQRRSGESLRKTAPRP